MSDEAKIDQLTAENGELVRLKLRGKLYLFRRPKRAELVHFQKQARSTPDMAIEHAIGLCRVCFVGPGNKDDLEKMLDDYPMAFAGDRNFDGVSDLLIKLSRGDADLTVK